MTHHRARGIALAFVAALGLAVSPALAQTTLTQSFSSSWTVSPWDYYGDFAAMQWHYIPYQPWDGSLGNLLGVRVHTTMSGERELASDPVAIRYFFFTGWAPDVFQFGSTFSIPAGFNGFNVTQDFAYTTPSELSRWSNITYYPPANYYFESRTVQGAHTITAQTDLTYEYTAVTPEPMTMILLGTGLFGIVGARLRRRKERDAED